MEIKGSNVNSKLKIKEDSQIGKKLAKEIMVFADDNSSAVSKKEFQNKLNRMEKLSTQNLIKFIRSFDKDESVIELIVDEVGSSKDERKNACKKVLNALVNKAKELGIDTFDFEKQFNTELNIQFRQIGFVDTEKLDSIINAITQAIENRQNFTEEDIQAVQNTPAAEGQNQANGVIENRLEKAYAAFGERVGEDGKMTTKDKDGKTYNGQMQRDGIAADIADGVSRIWGSENTAAKVRKDLQASNAQLQQLKEAKLQGEEAYKAKFKEIFGIEYDYANMVAYQKAEATYISASANYEFEMSFNRTLKTLLSPAPLREEVRYDSPDPMTNMVITTVTATKSQVYSREFNNLANFLTQKDSNGNEIKGSEILNKAFEEKGVANGNIEEKFEVLKQIAQALSKQLHSATLEAGGGKEFSEVQAMYDNSYKAAYGVENDIMKRVTDYNVSQEMGAGVVKAGTAIAVSLIAAFTGVGLVGVAAWTAGATVATEVIDRGTSGNALNALREQGLEEYLKTVSKDVDWEATLKQAAMSGTAVLIGGGVAQGVTAIMKGSSSVAQFAAMLGSDVITDATMEFFMTKQITWEGMVFTILLSTIGNAAQLKQMKNATTTSAAKSVDNVFDGARHNNQQIAREFMDLPPVREGYIRLVHRTSSEAAESIAKSGLYSAQGLDDTASAMRSATDFQNFLTSGAKEHRQATTVVIMDMPIEEFRILSRGSISDTYNPYGNSHIYYSEKVGISNNGYKNPKYLVCPAKYVVGICEHAENLPIQEVNRITLQNAKNPLPQVEETDLTIFDRFKVSEQELEIEDSWFDLNSSVETTNKKVTSNLSSNDTEVGNDMVLKAAREKLKRDLANRGKTIEQKNNNLTSSNASGYVDEFGQIHRKPPRGYVIDSKTGQPIKVNINKATIEVSENSISISDEFGNLLGHVSVDGGGVILKDGSKALHFQGLVSNVEGVGIGTKLIQELVKISEARGFEGRLIATASSMRADKLTNLGFYYKLGFKATDTQKHTAILDCIRNNKEITLDLNHNTEIVFVPQKNPAIIGNAVQLKEMKNVTLEDYTDIVNYIDELGFFKTYNKFWILDNVKTKDDIEVVKKLLSFKFENGKVIDEFDIKDLLSKLKTIEETEAFLLNCQENTIRQQIFYYNTPYYNLCNMIKLKSQDKKYFEVLIKVLDTPDKIKKVETYFDDIKDFGISRVDIQKAYENITGNSKRNNQKLIKELIAETLGKDVYEKDFMGQIELVEMALHNNAQIKAIKELLSYYDTPFFKYSKLNRQDLNILLEEVIPQIKTEEDVVIIKSLLNKSCSNKNEIYVSSELRDQITSGKYFSNDEIFVEYKNFIFEKAKSYDNPEEFADLYLNSVDKITSTRMVNSLKDYYKGADLHYFDKLLNDIQNDFALEALEQINKFNKQNPRRTISPYRSYRDQSFLRFIDNQDSLDFFINLLNKNTDIQHIGKFLELGDTKLKQETILLLLDECYSNGKKKFNNDEINKILDIIKNNDDLDKLVKSVKAKTFGLFERKINLEVIMEDIYGAKCTNYYTYLKIKYPYLDDLHRVAISIENDTDLDFVIKLLNKGLSPNLLVLTKNDKEARALIVDIIENKINHLGILDIEKYLQEPNGKEKIKKLLTLSPEQYYKDLNDVNESSMFFTDNYIKELQSVKHNNKLKHFEENIPIKNALSQTEAGEVFSIGNKLYIKDEGNLISLKISKKTFEKLFPLGKQFNTRQGALLGDCWLVATIDVLMQSPKGRVKIFSLFEETTNGDILIRLPNAKPEIFPGAKPYSKGIFKHIEACDGLKMLEEACAFAEHNRKNIDLSIYADIEKTMKILVGGDGERGFRILLGENGALPSISNKDMFEEILNNMTNKPNVVIKTSIKKGVSIPSEISSKYNLVSGHAYNINGYDLEHKIVYLVNPHNTKYRIEIPLTEYQKYFSNMDYLELK